MEPARKPEGVNLGLSDKDKEELLKIARTVIEAKAAGKPLPTIIPTSAKLQEKYGAFVSIHKRGMLRGCIGSLQADEVLYKQVEEMAEAAAFRDPRFRAVSEEELPYLEIEISVLTPMVEIQDPEEIQVGVHGLVMRRGFCSGLLLPQVASERNWDRITFLKETCRKAGLPENAWQDKETTIYVFSAEVF
jgi:AmmeMemoRadiSam system protein A